MENTKSAEKKIQDATERGRKQAVGFIDKASSLGEDLMESVQEKGEEYWEKAKTTCQDLLDEVATKGERRLKAVKIYTQRKPAQSIGMALLAGLILGFLWAPRKAPATPK